MIPSPWHFVILSLAVYRAVRFAGWDDWPPIYRVRAWVIGETWHPLVVGVPEYDVDDFGFVELVPATDTPSLPGKQPTSEVDEVRPAYSRPVLAHMVHCPFCMGAWISLATYLLWLLFPHAVVGLAVVPAFSAVAGLLAKNWDA